MNEILKWIIENWFMLIIVISVLTISGINLYGFIKTPKTEQLEKVKKWLLQAVIEAERQMGEKTGQAKLSLTYDMFVARFPAIASFISFETFSLMVDEALEKMRTMLESNKNLQDYIYGKEE